MSLANQVYRTAQVTVIFFAAALVCLLAPTGQAASGASAASRTIDGVEISDPTRPLDWRAGAAATSRPDATRPKLKVNSILISPARRLAIINGRSVAEGGTIEGVKVQRVSADGVQLRWQGEQWTARLSAPGSAVRQPVRTQP